MDINASFVTFVAFVAAVGVVSSLAIKVASNWVDTAKVILKVIKVRQLISWLVAFVLAAFATWRGLGMFATMEYVEALGYGFGAGLVSNGVFDIAFVEAFLKGVIFKPKDNA